MGPWIVIVLLGIVSGRIEGIGVNWGRAASHPLPPWKVVELLKSNGITKVKLLDSNPEVLESLYGSNIDVTVGVPNSMLRSLNSSFKVAQSWVHDNLARYFSDRLRIEYNLITHFIFFLITLNAVFVSFFHTFLYNAFSCNNTLLLWSFS